MKDGATITVTMPLASANALVVFYFTNTRDLSGRPDLAIAAIELAVKDQGASAPTTLFEVETDRPDDHYKMDEP